jgi:uncharacterized protein YndB with AHSA1/START domain
MTTITEAQTTQVYRVFIKATPEAIWEAITDPEFTQKYFYGMRIATSADRRLTEAGEGADITGEDPVVEWDPPRKLVHGWQSKWNPEMAAEEPSRVTWEIDPGEDGIALLTVVHDRLEGAPKTASAVAGPGWMRVLSGLKTLLETGEPLA